MRQRWASRWERERGGSCSDHSLERGVGKVQEELQGKLDELVCVTACCCVYDGAVE